VLKTLICVTRPAQL